MTGQPIDWLPYILLLCIQVIKFLYVTYWMYQYYFYKTNFTIEFKKKYYLTSKKLIGLTDKTSACYVKKF